MFEAEPDRAALAQARTEERNRIRSILTANEAVGREQPALNLALNSDMTVEGAIATLKSLPYSSGAAPAPIEATKEIGSGLPGSASDAAKAGWAAAIGGINREIKSGGGRSGTVQVAR